MYTVYILYNMFAHMHSFTLICIDERVKAIRLRTSSSDLNVACGKTLNSHHQKVSGSGEMVKFARGRSWDQLLLKANNL